MSWKYSRKDTPLAGRFSTYGDLLIEDGVNGVPAINSPSLEFIVIDIRRIIGNLSKNYSILSIIGRCRDESGNEDSNYQRVL